MLAAGLLLLLASAATHAIEVGDPAPAFELPRLDGDGELTLAELRGRWVYLDFWASWCVPCRESFPWMNRLASGAAPGDLRVVAVGLDRERDDAEAFLRRYPAEFAVVWDGDWRTPEAYGVETMPSSYLIDPEGVVRFVHRGFRAADKKRLRQHLAAVIDKQGN
jgi:thiol-disulfide isomerase/thioredoxin